MSYEEAFRHLSEIKECAHAANHAPNSTYKMRVLERRQHPPGREDITIVTLWATCSHCNLHSGMKQVDAFSPHLWDPPKA